MTRPPPTVRPLAALAERDHDLVVVGGGITGCCCALDAARRGVRVALIERADFGGATSSSSHRILHGGLRYLQSMDVARARESIRARRWFLAHFPELTRPLRCVLPLYGEGLRRPAPFRAALWANAALSADRNRGVCRGHRLAMGGVVSAREDMHLHPLARREGLRGFGVWHDGLVLSHARLTMAILRWANSLGAMVTDHAELDATALGLRHGRGGVTGVIARDTRTGEEHTLRASSVIYAGGPWGPGLLGAIAADVPGLYPPALAFNLLLDRDAPGEDALAVSAPGGATYFLVPRAGRLMAGTTHLPATGERMRPTGAEVRAMLDALNAAAPGLRLQESDVLRVDAGVLAGEPDGEPLDRPLVVDHGRGGGLAGLISVRGVKYTTAPLVAAKAVEAAVGKRAITPEGRSRPAPSPTLADLDLADPAWAEGADLSARAGELAAVMGDEGAPDLVTFLTARTEWAQDPRRAGEIGARLAAALGWDPARTARELESLERALEGDRPMFNGPGVPDEETART